MHTTLFTLDSTNYIGMDLHSNNVFVCIIRNAADSQGRLTKKVVARFKVSLDFELRDFEQRISPYCANQPHLATVESTYNWYHLADFFEQKGWNLKLADPTTVANNKLKNSDDVTDAEYLADQLRIGQLRAYDIVPKEARNYRDLVRQRVDVIQARAEHRTKLKNFFNNHCYTAFKTSQLTALSKQAVKGNLDDLYALLDDHHAVLKAARWLRTLHFFDSEVERIEEEIKREQLCDRLECFRYLPLLRSMKGCGFVLSSIIATEIIDIRRFRTDKDFVSYCRLSPSYRLSNGKEKGEGNRKNGNAYLSWSMTELANLMVQHNTAIKSKYDKLFKKSKLRAKAIRAISAKLARCIWHMLQNNEEFDIDRAFN